MSPPVIPLNLALLGSYPGCLNPSSSYLPYSSHIPRILVPLVHFYSGPTVLKFQVLLVVVEVRGGWVVVIIVVEMIRAMGTATVTIVI